MDKIIRINSLSDFNELLEKNSYTKHDILRILLNFQAIKMRNVLGNIFIKVANLQCKMEIYFEDVYENFLKFNVIIPQNIYGGVYQGVFPIQLVSKGEHLCMRSGAIEQVKKLINTENIGTILLPKEQLKKYKLFTKNIHFYSLITAVFDKVESTYPHLKVTMPSPNDEFNFELFFKAIQAKCNQYGITSRNVPNISRHNMNFIFASKFTCLDIKTCI